MNAIVPISAKIVPLIARLGSDAEGERLACLRQLDRVLGRAGLSWTDLARQIECAMGEPAIRARSTRMPRPETDRQILDWLLKDAVGATFTDRELEFLENLRDCWPFWRPDRPEELRSAKQRKWCGASSIASRRRQAAMRDVAGHRMSAHSRIDAAGSAPVKIQRDPRDAALLTAPGGIKGAVVALLHGRAEFRDASDLADLVDGTADVLMHRLDRDERGLLLMAAAQAAEPEDLEALAEAVVAGDGPPLPPRDDIQTEAAKWAAFASKSQVRAVLAAALAVLPAGERADLLAAVARRRGRA